MTPATTTGIELSIVKIVSGGEGLAFLDGRAVFVPFAAPGERIEARITEDGGDWLRAEIIRVLEPGPARVEPACPVFGLCGGCNLQHLSYESQLGIKSAVIAETFRRVAGIETGSVPIAASPPYAYRNRMQLHISKEGRLGFMRRNSNELVAVTDCPVAAPAIRRWIEKSSRSAKLGVELAPFIGSSDRFLAFGTGSEFFMEGRDRSPKVLIAGDPIEFSMKGFFQSNLAMLEILIADIFPPDGSAAGEGEADEKDDGEHEKTRAADLYSGVGLFGHFLAAKYDTILCVESEARSLEYARGNIPRGKGEFYAIPVEAWVKTPRARGRFDFIIADPPRQGMDASVIEWLSLPGSPELVYISCDPVTLARDSARLVAAGRRVESIKAYDFYPQTGHIECAVRFSCVSGGDDAIRRQTMSTEKELP